MGAYQQIGFAPSPAVMAILSRFDRPTLEAFLTVAVDLLDTLDPDPDAEQSTWPEATDAREVDAGLPEDSEAGGDERDTSWNEWHARGRHKVGKSEMADATIPEDDEDDDPGEEHDDDRCGAHDDDPTYGNDDGGPGEADDGEPNDDAEIEQMSNDVPMLPVVSYEHNLFNDQRTCLGFSNLMTSFVAGREVRSSDSGKMHRGNGNGGNPGTPI